MGVYVKFFSAKNLALGLPVSIESATSLPPEQGVTDEDVRVFPRMDTPPAYSKIGLYSTPSDKSLRAEESPSQGRGADSDSDSSADEYDPRGRASQRSRYSLENPLSAPVSPHRRYVSSPLLLSFGVLSL